MWTNRDYEYVESRLMAPCVPALDAVERLRMLGRDDLKDELMEACADFTDRCRAIRSKAHTEYKEHVYG